MRTGGEEEPAAAASVEGEEAGSSSAGEERGERVGSRRTVLDLRCTFKLTRLTRKCEDVVPVDELIKDSGWGEGGFGA
jgi:hypothetical protein